MSQRANNSTVIVFSNRPRDWTQQELSEFYRVENALTQSGLSVSSDRGLSDEGDPWFVFFRTNDQETLVHFARVDGYYIIASSAYNGVARGKNFKEMILDLLSKHRLNTEIISKNSNVFYHPAALLITLVGVAFFKSTSYSKAVEINSSEMTPHANKSQILSYHISTAPTSIPVNATPRIAPYQTGSSFDPIAGLILPMVAELIPYNPDASSANTTNPELKIDTSFLENTLHKSMLNKNTFVNSKQNLISSDPANVFGLESELEFISHGNKTDLSFALSDAKYLLNLLYDVPISADHVDLAGFQLKLHSNFKVGNPDAPVMFYTETTSKFLDQHLCHMASKPTQSTSVTSESVQKSIINDTNSARLDENHSSSTHTTTLFTVGTEHQNQPPIIDYKIAINTVAASAIIALNHLSISFNYQNWEVQDSNMLADAINLTNQIDSPKRDFIAKEKVPFNDISGYEIFVTDNRSQTFSTINSTDIISINLGENEINNLLLRFLQTFSRSSFEIKASDEFVFRTEASKSSLVSLENVTIHFHDGSNIDIIGLKSEIDGFMTTL